MAQEIGGLAVAADVSSEADVEHYLATTVERSVGSTCTISTPGSRVSLDPLPDLDLASFERVMSVNVSGMFLGLRGAFRQYAAQGSGGAVVVTGSIASLRGSADLFAYHTSKHAVLGLARSAAVYGGPLGVRVNVVAPGIVPTELFAGAGGATGGGSDMAHRATTTPLRRAGSRAEIGAVVAFLLSDEASYMTGEVVSVDGGATTTNSLRPSGAAAAGILRLDQGLSRPRHGQADIY